MSSPQREDILAQMDSDVDDQEQLTKVIISKQSPAPMNDDKPPHRLGHADKPSDEEEEDLATEQMKSMKERKHSRGRERKKYEEVTERQEQAEKRGRRKVRHKNEKGSKEETEKGEPFESCVIFQQNSHKQSVPSSLRTRSRGLSRSKSAASRSKRKTREVSNNHERRQYLKEMIDESLQPSSRVAKHVTSSTKTKRMKGHQKATSLWRNVCRTARVIYDGLSFGLGLFVTYFLKYLVVFLILVLLISVTHRATCEVPLVRYYHPSCTAVWAPTPLSSDTQQDHALSQLADPLQRHSETLNQLQGNEYFYKLPDALFQSSRWLRQMGVVLQVTSVEIPSREQTVKELGKYVGKSKEMGYKLSKIWAKIPTTVHLVLLERKDVVKDLERIHSEATDNRTLTSVLDVPGLLWSFVATSLLSRPILTPHQARQVGEEQARISLLRILFPRLRDLLDGLANDISSAVKDFEELTSSVHKIQGFLFGDICNVSSSTSRDLLPQAEPHPYYQFHAFFGREPTQSFDLRTREAQLQLLSTTNATMTITIRELATMENVIRGLSNDMDNMMGLLNLYETSLSDGKISVDGLLRAVKVGIDTLARGRETHQEKQRQLREKESRESDEKWARATEGLRDLVGLHSFG